MAVYQTGTATDVNDLLSKLNTFAVANGWTLNNASARTTGTGNAVQLNKGGRYVTFRTDNAAGTTANPSPRIGCYAHDTYNGANGTENQANASGKCMANNMPGPFVAYHFLSGTERGSEYLYCIVEVTAGIFKHFGTGTFVGIGAQTTGQFVFGSFWDYTVNFIDQKDDQRHGIPFECLSANFNSNPFMHIRLDAESITWRWMEGSNSPTIAGRGMIGGFRNQGTVTADQYIMLQCAASSITGRNMLWPCFMSAARTGGLYNRVGYPPGVRWVSLANLSPNATLTIGTDQWKVFPVIRKNGTTGQPNSGTYGYAYKVN